MTKEQVSAIATSCIEVGYDNGWAYHTLNVNPLQLAGFFHDDDQCETFGSCYTEVYSDGQNTVTFTICPAQTGGKEISFNVK